MKVLVLLFLVACLLLQLHVVETKTLNVKIWGRKYWVDLPFIKEKVESPFDKDYSDMTEEERIKYVSKVVSMPPSEGRKHVWEMGKKWLQKQFTESKDSIVEDAREVMDAKIPSDRAYAVVHFAINHKVVTAAGVAGLYYGSRLLLGPSPSERAMAKVREYQDKLNKGKKL